MDDTIAKDIELKTATEPALVKKPESNKER